MCEPVPDAGEDGDRDETPEWAVTWDQLGRELLRGELSELRFGLEDAFRAAEDALYGEYDGEGEYSGELTREHIHALRVALNRARERVETQVAPVAGVEPWGDPTPRMPMGVMWKLTDHPKAEGIDAREYVDDEGADE